MVGRTACTPRIGSAARRPTTRRFDARRTFEMEFRLRRADGVYRWILDRGVPRFSPSGVFSGYVGSCLDITDLKQSHDGCWLPTNSRAWA